MTSTDRLRDALKPFADYADPNKYLADDFIITNGSTFAKRQIRMGDCRRAKEALAAAEAPPSRIEVTEVDVNAALQGFDTGVGDPNDYRKRMRAALEAALRQKENG